ncbi:response regulator transcription factor [Streptomyces rhizosphaericola]|uniref:response regulator transcription factor n=1 Tax=Streptomyces rhizosphaericola TaxID=2564098 RepID=UPI001441D0D0|nr:response regulator transcription factor [Streptomyces rhizosphaericola]
MTIRAHVVADHELIGEGLRSIIGSGTALHVVEPRRGIRRMPLARVLPPDVVILSVSDWNDTSALLEQAIKSGGSVLVLLHEVELEQAGQLLASGATGVLKLSQAADCLHWAVPAASRGALVLPPEFSSRFLDTYLKPVHACMRKNAARDRLALLSPRELDVLRQVALGRTNPDVAKDLSLSVHTVKDHLRNISRKFSESTRVGMARIAWEADQAFGRDKPPV